MPELFLTSLSLSKTLRLLQAERRDGTLKSWIYVTYPKLERGWGESFCTKKIPLWKLAKWLEGPSRFLQDGLIRSLCCCHLSGSPNLCIPMLVRVCGIPEAPWRAANLEIPEKLEVFLPPRRPPQYLLVVAFLILAKQIFRYWRFRSKSSLPRSVSVVWLVDQPIWVYEQLNIPLNKVAGESVTMHGMISLTISTKTLTEVNITHSEIEETVSSTNWRTNSRKMGKKR